MTFTELKQVAEWGEQGMLQWRGSTGWTDYNQKECSVHDYELFSIYRRRPESKLRPWKPEEVPIGALIKWDDTIALIAFANKERFGFFQVSPNRNGADDRSWDYFKVYDCIKYSLDHGKTWLACGVVEEQQ